MENAGKLRCEEHGDEPALTACAVCGRLICAQCRHLDPLGQATCPVHAEARGALPYERALPLLMQSLEPSPPQGSARSERQPSIARPPQGPPFNYTLRSPERPAASLSADTPSDPHGSDRDLRASGRDLHGSDHDLRASGRDLHAPSRDPHGSGRDPRASDRDLRAARGSLREDHPSQAQHHGGGLSAQQGAGTLSIEDEMCPWEGQPHLDSLTAFLRTARLVIGSPMRFPAMQRWERQNFLAPLVFALLCVGIGSLLSAAVHLVGLGPTAGAKLPANLPGPLSNLPAAPFAFYELFFLPLMPLISAVGILLHAGIAHLFLRTSNLAQGPFERTFRVICYAQAAYLVAWVPNIGPLLQNFYLVFLILGGTRSAHNGGYLAGLLVFLPLMLAYFPLTLF